VFILDQLPFDSFSIPADVFACWSLSIPEQMTCHPEWQHDIYMEYKRLCINVSAPVTPCVPATGYFLPGYAHRLDTFSPTTVFRGSSFNVNEHTFPDPLQLPKEHAQEKYHRRKRCNYPVIPCQYPGDRPSGEESHPEAGCQVSRPPPRNGDDPRCNRCRCAWAFFRPGNYNG